MTVIDISAARPTRNPPLSAPIFKNDKLANCIAEMGKDITMLRLAKDSAALSNVDDELIEGLELIYARLRREHDRLCMLL